jgi:hypothetical protein
MTKPPRIFSWVKINRIIHITFLKAIEAHVALWEDEPDHHVGLIGWNTLANG